MKNTVLAFIVGTILVGASIGFVVYSNRGAAEISDGSNVAVIDGVQFITLKARGGYSPEVTVAQAGVPTILKVDTKGTFDCSSAVSIPALNVSRPPTMSGVTEIDLGTPEAGTLDGGCSMGMYPFQIQFR